MPIVPRYSNPEVQIGSTPIPQMRRIDTSSGIAAIGDALSGMSNQMFAAFKEEQRKADDSAVTEAYDKMLRSYDTISTGALGTEGETAIGGKNDDGTPRNGIDVTAMEDFDKTTAEITKTLSNDRQRELFRQKEIATRHTLEKSVLAHVVGERAKVQDARNKALLDTQINVAGLASTEDDQAKVLDDIQETLSRIYENQPEEVYTAARDKVWSGLHETWLLRDAKVNPAQALETFKSWKENGDLQADAIARLDDKLKHVTVAQLGNTAAADIWSTLGPSALVAADTKGKYRGNVDLAPVDLVKMQAEIDKRFSDNPDAAAAAMTKIHAFAQAHDYTVRQNRDANTSVIYERLASEGLGAYSSIIQSPEYNALDGRDQEHFKSAIRAEKRAIDAERRGRLAEVKRERAEKRAEFMGSVTPEMLAGMSESDIRKWNQYLEPSDVNRLISARKSYLNNQDELSRAKADDSLIREIAYDAGMNYAYQPKTASQKATIGKLRETVEQVKAFEQLRGQQKITPEREREIIREQLRKVSARTGSGWFGAKTGEKFQFEVEPYNYEIPGASSEDVGMVVGALQRRGIARPTYDQVQRGIEAFKRGRR